MQKEFKVQLPQGVADSYSIVISPSLLKNPLSWLPQKAQDLVIITDSWVEQYYAEPFKKLLESLGKSVKLYSFPAGEASKTIATKCQIEEKMLEDGVDRHALILALGGGVVGDLAGFIAATYMRGIDYIQIPTTLLAMLDSSVGGKTGIDSPQGKNLIGAFWQPKAVISDIHCLQTLSQNMLINGLIEGAKVFLTSSAQNFSYLEQNLDLVLNGNQEMLTAMVYEAVKIKAQVVMQDEKENNLRMILNFGHTIGHALEKISNYQMQHGYAVGYGILIEAKISELLGFLKADDYQRIKTFFERLDIKVSDLCFDKKSLIRATQFDKKKQKGKAAYVLLSSIGEVVISEERYAHPVPEELLITAIDSSK